MPSVSELEDTAAEEADDWRLRVEAVVEFAGEAGQGDPGGGGGSVTCVVFGPILGPSFFLMAIDVIFGLTVLEQETEEQKTLPP